MNEEALKKYREISDDMPRSVVVRITMLALSDMGQMAPNISGAVAAGTDELVREIARVVLECHDRLAACLSHAKERELERWQEYFGEPFEASVRRGALRGGASLRARPQPGGVSQT